MTSHPDFVVVDDTSTSQPEQIKYSTGWNQQSFSGNLGGAGPPLYQSLHVATSPATFTFTYNGAAGPLFIYGSISSNSPPTWSCTLDNKPMTSISNGQSSPPISNHVPICSLTSQTTPIGDHTLRVSVTASENSPAFFDYILYTPPSVVRPGDLFFESKNAGLQFSGSGWQTDGNNGIATSNSGDTLDFIFRGHTVSWVGFFDGTQGNKQASAMYSIDGSSPVTFSITNTASGSNVLTEQVFFQSASQGPGQHHLQVVYLGAAGSTPLALDHLIVQNSTVNFALPSLPEGGGSGNGGTSIVSSGGTGDTSMAGAGSGGSSGVGSDTGDTSVMSQLGGSNSGSTLTNLSFSSFAGKPTSTRSGLVPPTTTLMFLPSMTDRPTSSTSTGKSSLHGAKVAGICLGIFVVIGFVVVCVCQVRRARRRTSGNSSQITQPFPNVNRPPPVPEKEREHQSANGFGFPDVEQQSPATVTSNTRMSKARRFAEATASTLRRYRSRSRSRSRRLNRSLSSSGQLMTVNDSSTSTNGRTVRMVMHQDSGVPMRQPDSDEVEVVIEVPPAYASIR